MRSLPSIFIFLSLLILSNIVIVGLPLLCGRYNFKNHQIKHPYVALTLFLAFELVLLTATIVPSLTVQLPFAVFADYLQAIAPPLLISSLCISGYIFIKAKEDKDGRQRLISKILKPSLILLSILTIGIFIIIPPKQEYIAPPTIPDDESDPNYQGHIIEPDENGDCEPSPQTVIREGLDMITKNKGGYKKGADGKCHWVNAYTGYGS